MTHHGSRRVGRVSFVLAAAALLAGCGGLSRTVSRKLLSDISIENKLQLFESENDVAIAIDEREQLLREGQGLRKQRAVVEDQLEDAEGDLKRAEDKNDAKAQVVAALAIEVIESKLAYLDAQEDALDVRLDAQDDLTRVALAKYELAKAKIVRRNNVSGASDLDVDEFEEQVDEAVERARDAQKDAAEAQAQVEAASAKWLELRAKLEKESGGGLGNPWAEDTSTWGWQ